MIYTVENTRGIGKPVKVFVDGQKIDYAVYADTEKGIVECLSKPLRVKEGTDIAETEVLRGVVTVVPKK